MERIGNLYFHGSRDNREIALTFDDVPSEKTRKILDLLKKYDAQATFFVIGNKISKNKEIIKQIVRQGCEIGNHSFNHSSLVSKSKKFIEEQIRRTDEELNKIGIKTILFRPPFLRIGGNLLKIIKKLDKRIILLDVHSKDWSGISDKVIINRVLSKTKNGSIINLHDYIERRGRTKI